MTGQQLADRVGMSQAKISRIETGKSPADPPDVRALAVALGLPEAEQDLLVERAAREYDRMTDWRLEAGGLTAKQREVATYERAAHQVRVFQPSIIPGLLQTSGYASAVMATAHRMLAGSPGEDAAAELYAAVAARMQRQEALVREAKRFSFVLTESTLSNRLCSPEEMLAQLRKVRDLARQDNISVRIIPMDATLTDPPIHSFELLDDEWLIIDLFNTSLTSQGRNDLRIYRRLFDDLERVATADIGTVLERHAAVYRGLVGPLSEPTTEQRG
jgi:transcriptional regulator with XRE-family HTH domain